MTEDNIPDQRDWMEEMEGFEPIPEIPEKKLGTAPVMRETQGHPLFRTDPELNQPSMIPGEDEGRKFRLSLDVAPFTDAY